MTNHNHIGSLSDFLRRMDRLENMVNLSIPDGKRRRIVFTDIAPQEQVEDEKAALRHFGF